MSNSISTTYIHANLGILLYSLISSHKKWRNLKCTIWMVLKQLHFYLQMLKFRNLNHQNVAVHVAGNINIGIIFFFPIHLSYCIYIFRKKCCCCITSWKCCGIVTGITLLIIGLLLGMAAWSFHKRYLSYYFFKN